MTFVVIGVACAEILGHRDCVFAVGIFLLSWLEAQINPAEIVSPPLITFGKGLLRYDG